jgi:hypothetical protein
VLFVGTYRNAELAHLPDIAELLGNLRLGSALPLAGVRRDEMGALVHQSFAGTLSDAVVTAVHAATDGNPFFALANRPAVMGFACSSNGTSASTPASSRPPLGGGHAAPRSRR